MSKMRESNIVLKFDSWEKQVEEDKKNGEYIKIADASIVNRKNVSGRENSIFDKKLGLNLGATQETENTLYEFLCECGALTDKYREGCVCAKCGTSVEKRYSADLNIHAYIELPQYDTKRKYKILIPNQFQVLAKYFTRKVLMSIITIETDMDYDGKIVIKKTRSIDNSISKYYNIGLIGFYDKFEEIITLMSEKRLTKKSLRDDRHYDDRSWAVKEQASKEFLIANKEAIFSSYIYVPPPTVRPAVLMDGKKPVFRYDEINRMYNNIIISVNTLKSTTTTTNRAQQMISDNNSIINNIQIPLVELHKTCLSRIGAHKKARMRGALIGTRLDFSSRQVSGSRVSPSLPSIDSVEIGIRPFLEIYKYTILNVLHRDAAFADKTTWDLLGYIRDQINAKYVDDYIIEIVNKLVKKHKQGFWVLVNRNPTMDLGSIQALRICSVSRDSQNIVISIPLTSMPAMNGDVDGDVLNIFALMEYHVLVAFLRLCPSIMINNTRGELGYDRKFIPGKDQMVALFNFLRKKKGRALTDDAYLYDDITSKDIDYEFKGKNSDKLNSEDFQILTVESKKNDKMLFYDARK